jgi:hypothetical protein
MTAICRSALPGVALFLFSSGLFAQTEIALPARDIALRGSPAVVYRVSAAEGRGFGRIIDIAFDAADNAYVLDINPARVLVFDASGRFIREFGKRGAGVGELYDPASIDITSDGLVAVHDSRYGRITLFRPTGEYVRVVLLGSVYERPDRMIADARGGVFMQAIGNRDASGTDRGWFVYHVDLGSADSMQPRYELPGPKVTIREGVRANGYYVATLEAYPVFGAIPSWGALPDGSFAVHHRDEYAIDVIDDSGRLTRRLTRPLQPRAVTEADRDAERVRWANGQGRAPGYTHLSLSLAMIQLVGPPTEPLEPPPHSFAGMMSVVSRIVTDVAGRIWVQRRARDGASHGPIDLISAQGRYIGTLSADQQIPVAVSATHLAAYGERDKAGIQSIVVKRLPATWQ